MNWLKKLYNNYIKKEVEKDSNEMNSIINEFLKKSSSFNEAKDLAQRAIEKFNKSKKTSLDLQIFFTDLYRSTKLCKKDLANFIPEYKDDFFYSLVRDIVEGNMYTEIKKMIMLNKA